MIMICDGVFVSFVGFTVCTYTLAIKKKKTKQIFEALVCFWGLTLSILGIIVNL